MSTTNVAFSGYWERLVTHAQSAVMARDRLKSTRLIRWLARR